MNNSFEILAAFALYVIFTILGSFSQDNTLFASKAKSNFFRIFFNSWVPEEVLEWRKFFKKIDFNL